MKANGAQTNSPATGWMIPSSIAIIAANCVPLYGVMFLGWKVFPVIFLFWIENVIIGIMNAGKMLFAAPGNPVKWAGKLFIIPFFCIHYGLFTSVHGVFVIALFGGDSLNVAHHHAMMPNISAIYAIIAGEQLGWAVLCLAVGHIISFLFDYIGRGEYRDANLTVLMQQPYGRVVVMHLALIGGGYLLLSLHSPVAGLVLLVLLKIALDIRQHTKERLTLAAPNAGSPFRFLPAGNFQPTS
jgi:hypothetical protein